MRNFNCEECDFCCTRQTWEDMGILRGIALFPDEIQHFPEWAVFPLFRHGREVFACQLGEHVCPVLSHGRCSIYGSHPLICKAFPVCYEPMKGLAVSFSRCPRIQNSREEDFNYDSFEKCFAAARERKERERGWPKATAIFSLKTKSWVELPQ